MEPVKLNEVPGYSDIIENPMDFGTMSRKIDLGRYRSIEEFEVRFLYVKYKPDLLNILVVRLPARN